MAVSVPPGARDGMGWDGMILYRREEDWWRREGPRYITREGGTGSTDPVPILLLWVFWRGIPTLARNAT